MENILTEDYSWLKLPTNILVLHVQIPMQKHIAMKKQVKTLPKLNNSTVTNTSDGELDDKNGW
jgi:hypothetical protein